MTKEKMKNNQNESKEIIEMLKKEQDIYKKADDLKVPNLNWTTIIMAFLKQLKPGMSLYRLQSPIQYVKPVSFLEEVNVYTHFYDWFVKIQDLKDPLERMIELVRWNLNCYAKCPQKGFSHCKPFNPILGEEFHCKCKHPDSETSYFCEQTSHHPPITSCVQFNEKEGLLYQSSFEPKLTYHGNYALMYMCGKHHLKMMKTNEDYYFTLPTFVTANIIFGSSYIELCGKLTIKCKQNKIRVSVDYKRGNNKIDGYIYNKDSNGTEKKIYYIYGKSDTEVKIKNIQTKKERVLFTYGDEKKRSKVVIQPSYLQKPNESRRVWHTTIREMVNKNYDKALDNKKIVEDIQRNKRKIRNEKNINYKPQYFNPTNEIYDNKVQQFLFKDIEKVKKNILETLELGKKKE